VRKQWKNILPTIIYNTLKELKAVDKENVGHMKM